MLPAVRSFEEKQARSVKSFTRRCALLVLCRSGREERTAAEDSLRCLVLLDTADRVEAVLEKKIGVLDAVQR